MTRNVVGTGCDSTRSDTVSGLPDQSLAVHSHDADSVPGHHHPRQRQRCCGDSPALEALAAVSILREHLPELKIRVVNVMRLRSASEHPHGLSDRDYDALFTADKHVVFAFHGYPTLHRRTYWRTNRNMHGRGYNEEGTITTAFDMRGRTGRTAFTSSVTSSTGSRSWVPPASSSTATTGTACSKPGWSSATSNTNTTTNMGIRPWVTERQPSTLRRAGTPRWPAPSTESRPKNTRL